MLLLLLFLYLILMDCMRNELCRIKIIFILQNAGMTYANIDEDFGRLEASRTHQGVGTYCNC